MHRRKFGQRSTAPRGRRDRTYRGRHHLADGMIPAPWLTEAMRNKRALDAAVRAEEAWLVARWRTFLGTD